MLSNAMVRHCGYCGGYTGTSPLSGSQYPIHPAKPYRKKGESEVAQPCPTLCDPMDYVVHGILQASTEVGSQFPSPRDLPNPGIKPRSPAFQGDSLPAEPQRKTKNTGVGSLSLL